MAQSNAQLVRALIRKQRTPAVEASKKLGNKVIRASFREVYGPTWFENTRTKNLKKRITREIYGRG